MPATVRVLGMAIVSTACRFLCEMCERNIIMKKITFLIIGILALTLVSCGGGNDNQDSETTTYIGKYSVGTNIPEIESPDDELIPSEETTTAVDTASEIQGTEEASNVETVVPVPETTAKKTESDDVTTRVSGGGVVLPRDDF